MYRYRITARGGSLKQGPLIVLTDVFQIRHHDVPPSVHTEVYLSHTQSCWWTDRCFCLGQTWQTWITVMLLLETFHLVRMRRLYLHFRRIDITICQLYFIMWHMTDLFHRLITVKISICLAVCLVVFNPVSLCALCRMEAAEAVQWCDRLRWLQTWLESSEPKKLSFSTLQSLIPFSGKPLSLHNHSDCL